MSVEIPEVVGGQSKWRALRNGIELTVSSFIVWEAWQIDGSSVPAISN